MIQSGTKVRFIKMPAWVPELPAESRRVFEFCLGRIYRVEEVDSHCLFVLDVSADIDTASADTTTTFGWRRNTWRRSRSKSTEHALIESMPALRRFLLTRAFWNLAGFTLVALIFMPSISSPGLPPPFVTRARILLVIGTLLWLSTLIACLQAFCIPEESPSIIASFTFFLLLGLELLVLCGDARIL